MLIATALLPALPAVWTVRALLHRVLDPSLGGVVLDGAHAGMEAVRAALRSERAQVLAEVSSGASTHNHFEGRTPRQLAGELDAPDRARFQAWLDTVPVWEPERFTVRGRPTWIARLAATDTLALRAVDANHAPRLERATAALRLLETMRQQEPAVLRSLVLTFLAVYLAILLVVLLFGLYVASRLTRPLESLAGGMERVAAHDLETNLPVRSHGEMARLLQRFNEMVRRLRVQEHDLVRLEKAAAWRDMARRLAHEIKNPLTPIQLAAQQMRDTYRGEDPQHRALLAEGTEIIEDEVRGLRGLVDSFSRFARLPSPVPRLISLTELLLGVQSLFGESAVRIETPASGTDEIHGDPDELHRVLTNLVQNARTAQDSIGAGAPVLLSGERLRDGGAEIRVLDRGPGVLPQDRARIFEPNVSGSGGMGLGLAIALASVNAQGGTIVVSGREGRGAVFTVRLPAPATEQVTERAAERAENAK